MQELIKFKGIKMEFDLECQMPMIHFQSDQLGATLRATEVKPKLDAYLMEMEEGLTKEELDYKMQITLKKPGREIELDKITVDENKKKDRSGCYSIFYGNMGDGEKKYGIFSDPTVTIICFKEKIRKLLEENIVKFFLVTNFGTMQNKGFGSFIPKCWCEGNSLTETMKKEVADYLTEGNCYVLDFGKVPQNNFDEKNKFCVRMSEGIKDFYSIMKAGKNFGTTYFRSYIYQYGYEKLELSNEKYWMKKEGIIPKDVLEAACKEENREKHVYGPEKEQRYLRAFLGIGESIEYGTGYSPIGTLVKDPCVKVTIESEKISKDNKKFDRLESPIFFKVIKNVVFISAFEIPDELYGTRFKFSSAKVKKNKGKEPIKSDTICVPAKEELKDGKFNIQDFLKSYVNYYNDKVRKKEIVKCVKEDNR